MVSEWKKKSKADSDGTFGEAKLRQSPATIILIVVTCLVTAMQLLLAALSDKWDVQALLAVSPTWFSQNEWWRPFTANLVHYYGLPHLLINMYGLSMAGPPVERAIGPPRFVGIYVLSGFATMVAESACARWCSGASGALLGVCAAFFVHALVDSLRSQSAHGSLRQAALLSAAWLLSGPILNSIFGLDIRNTCHLVGFITGLVLGMGTYVERRGRPDVNCERR
jgi:membrane associated rhomboid family serine protease